jgi:hypothetical protein
MRHGSALRHSSSSDPPDQRLILLRRAFLQIWPTGPAARWPSRRHVDDLGDTHKIPRFFQMAPPMVPIYEP